MTDREEFIAALKADMVIPDAAPPGALAVSDALALRALYDARREAIARGRNKRRDGERP